MPVFLRICLTLLLVFTSGCIGASAYKNYGNNSSAMNGNTEIDRELNRRMLGLTRDDLILRYGPPSRTATLDTGLKLMQYSRKSTNIDEHGNRYKRNCELRLWLRDKVVRKVDYRGDQIDCLLFTSTARQNVINDDRRPK